MRLVGLILAAIVIFAGCASADDSALVDSAESVSEPAAIATVVPAAEAAPTSVPARQSDPPEEDNSGTLVPFPPPRNLCSPSPCTAEQDRVLSTMGRPRSIFDLYDDIAPIDDFVVYEGEQGQVLMTDAFVKEGLTYGYVAWTVDGVTQSTSSPASNELAMCAADVLAVSMDRFSAELVARGAFESVQEGALVELAEEGALVELLDLYIECGGTDELLTSFRDDMRLSPETVLDIACVEATVSTEVHLRIVSNESFDDFVELVGPCFDWSVIPFALEDSSLLCLESRNIDGLRSSLGNDRSGFAAILESCLTPEELAQISS